MDFIVGVDIYLNDMSYFSDIMLPECLLPERYDAAPVLHMNHRMIGSLDTPWTLAMWQPVVEQDSFGFMEIYAEIADRAGANEFFHPGGLRPVPREGRGKLLPTDQKLNVEQLSTRCINRMTRSTACSGSKKDNGGVYTYPRRWTRYRSGMPRRRAASPLLGLHARGQGEGGGQEA